MAAHFPGAPSCKSPSGQPSSLSRLSSRQNSSINFSRIHKKGTAMWDQTVLIIAIVIAGIVVIGGVYLPTLLRAENAWSKEICSSTVAFAQTIQDKTKFGDFPFFCSDIQMTVKPKTDEALAKDISKMATNCWETYLKGDNDQLKQSALKGFILDWTSQPVCFPCYTFTVEKTSGFGTKDSLALPSFKNYLSNHDTKGNKVGVSSTNSASQFIGESGFIMVAGITEFVPGEIYQVKYFDSDTQIKKWYGRLLTGSLLAGTEITLVSFAVDEIHQSMMKDDVEQWDPRIAEVFDSRDGILITKKSLMDDPAFDACAKKDSFDAGKDSGRVI